MLSFFKLGLCSLTFVVDCLETILNTSEEGCIYREVLEGFYYIKVLRVLRTIPNRPGDISVGSIKEVGECFACVRQRSIIYVLVVYFEGSGQGN